MAAGVKSLSKTFVWIIVGLLIVGLAGFGATNLSGTIRTVATVGDEIIGVDDFARDLQNEMRAVEAQTGQPVAMSRVRELQLDRIVMSRLVTLAALDHEAKQLGLSLGDANLQSEIMGITAFQGIDGKFDRETYRFALEQANLSEEQFEEDLRAESARTIVQNAIVSGVRMPPALTEMLIQYVGARRSFAWALLSEDNLETPVAEPSDADLRAYYDANTDDFMLPDTKVLTYVTLTPEMMLDKVDIDDDAVRKLYEERSSEYIQPERRLVERLVFADADGAKNALAQLEVNGTTFELLVQSRGLQLSDIDMGDVTRQDLDDAADDVFSAETGAVVGPLPSDLGPALFRINGRLAARETAFDDVAAELRDELAGERARRLIDSQVEAIADILAGGATLEDLARETDMALGAMSWTAQSFEGIAAYETFGAAAARVSETDFPEIEFLDDGGIFALRLDETLAARPEPFDAARSKIAQAWTESEVRKLAAAQAEKVKDRLAADGDLAQAGATFKVENGLTRTAFLEGTPADFMSQVFEMEKGETRVVASETGAIVVRLDDILPADDTNEMANIRNAIGQQMDQSLALALFNAYARDSQQRAGARVDERALNAVMASFN